jgi:hypothetical protein
MFGHCIAHDFELFSTHPDVRPGSLMRLVHGRESAMAGHVAAAALGGWLRPAMAWLLLARRGCGRPGCGSVPPGLAAAGYGCTERLP